MVEITLSALGIILPCAYYKSFLIHMAFLRGCCPRMWASGEKCRWLSSPMGTRRIWLCFLGRRRACRQPCTPGGQAGCYSALRPVGAGRGSLPFCYLLCFLGPSLGRLVPISRDSRHSAQFVLHGRECLWGQCHRQGLERTVPTWHCHLCQAFGLSCTPSSTPSVLGQLDGCIGSRESGWHFAADRLRSGICGDGREKAGG